MAIRRERTTDDGKGEIVSGENVHAFRGGSQNGIFVFLKFVVSFEIMEIENREKLRHTFIA